MNLVFQSTPLVPGAPVGHGVRISALVAVAVSAVLVAGCGGGKQEKAASQVAAKVNKEEISVHQINFVMQQQRGLRPEQADVASKQILERLVDQELALQKAQGLKLDRDPRVVQQLEAAKRDILARAYVEKAGEAASKPTAQEISKYYADKPALFKERRIYNIQEIAIEAKPDQIDGLRAKLTAAKTIPDFIDQLKAGNVNFAGNQAVRPAEQLPLNMLDSFSKMKDGQAMLVPSANGAQVIVLTSSRAEPVDEARAKPAIEQYLLNDAKRKVVEADIKALRTAAKIQYVGKFAEGAPTDVALAAPSAMPAPAAVAAPGTATTPAPATATATATPATAGNGLNAEAISKGMGLKQ